VLSISTFIAESCSSSPCVERIYVIGKYTPFFHLSWANRVLVSNANNCTEMMNSTSGSEVDYAEYRQEGLVVDAASSTPIDQLLTLQFESLEMLREMRRYYTNDIIYIAFSLSVFTLLCAALVALMAYEALMDAYMSGYIAIGIISTVYFPLLLWGIHQIRHRSRQRDLYTAEIDARDRDARQNSIIL
jgi:hypothetical protein